MAIPFKGQSLLLDIEGTTSSVRFVYDQMFPYVRREVESFLTQQLETPSVAQACQRMVLDSGKAQLARDLEQLPPSTKVQKLLETVTQLMDDDVKATGLKELQGLIWKAGFESGELKAHVYPDVPPALKLWSEAGRDIRIYSSGSITAQKLFFKHTEAGDLLSYLSGHYDTTIGPKKEANSYSKIAQAIGIEPENILFLSDIVEELDAARTAKMATGLSLRPENASIETPNDHPTFESFSEIQ